MALISLKEYAVIHGKSPVTARQRAARGCFKSARRIGSQWVIDSEEPWIDGRVITGKYRDWRVPKKSED